MVCKNSLYCVDHFFCKYKIIPTLKNSLKGQQDGSGVRMDAYHKRQPELNPANHTAGRETREVVL